ncbi:MAG TPA: TrmJ/YjtD family RNA methyltransferase [Candidatus Binataceae bacterium]|nr:TrmJ/YjtD family RNA methyltransferase [Candidatus Binataceae bacterium]
MAARDRFAFVLFRPKSAGNVGAAARAIKNMGFADLRIVGAPPSKGTNRRAAAAMAVHADDVLKAAATFADLPAALHDRTVTVGTTCRPGPYRSAARPLRETAAEMAALARSNRIAFIFGPEDHGLTNHELKLCQRLITIPTAPEYPSLNLAQAIVVVAYEMMMALGSAAPAREPAAFAPAVEVDAMLERIEQALVSIGFLPEDNPDHLMFTLRTIFGRSGLDARELDVMNGIARQVRWAALGGHATIAQKRGTGRKLR